MPPESADISVSVRMLVLSSTETSITSWIEMQQSQLLKVQLTNMHI